MKRYIKAYDSEEGYQPDAFNNDSVESILDDLEVALRNKFSRRYKDLQIDFDDISYEAFKISGKVDIYNGMKLKHSKVFEFSPYSDYWDISDYQQHLQTSIQKFVNDL